MHLTGKRILISKTNQIGDVTFALPLASAIKQASPTAQIIFLGREYTRALIEHYRDVDEFADWDSIAQRDDKDALAALCALNIDIILHVQPNKRLAYLAKKAKIPLRIGTSTRLYHWLTCNRRVKISRKHSPLHETQLDMQYLKALGLPGEYTLAQIIALRQFKPFKLSKNVKQYLAADKFNLILHPKTRGEHIEWAPEHFAQLIERLPKERFHIIITGSAKEGKQVRDTMITPFSHVVDLCGVLTLAQLQTLIAHAGGLIAASTGPVHLAASFGIHTLGLYAPIKPFHAGRWGPVGKQAQVLCINKDCNWCRDGRPCRCINKISVDRVYHSVMQWLEDS